MKFKYLISIIFVLCISLNAADFWKTVKENVTLLPDVEFDSDLRFFAFQKDSMFYEKYLCEVNHNIEIFLMRIRKNNFLIFRSDQKANMGHSVSGLVFAPQEIAFSLTPFYEYRTKEVFFQAGLDHRCFHEIDRDKKPTIYWNMLFMGVGSKNYRMHSFNNLINESDSVNMLDRLSWYFVWGYYVREFGGLIEPRKIMSDIPDYEHELKLVYRYALLNWKKNILNLTGTTMLDLGGKRTVFWQETGLEINGQFNRFGGSVFLNYIIDNGRFDSKDNLLEIGVRLYK